MGGLMSICDLSSTKDVDVICWQKKLKFKGYYFHVLESHPSKSDVKFPIEV